MLSARYVIFVSCLNLLDLSMKRILLAVLVILMGNTLSAQVLGTTLYNWDFNNGFPSGFQLGSANPIARWEYRGPNTNPNNTVASRGSCGSGTLPIASETASNGFVIFDSNYWDNDANPCAASFFGTGQAPAPHNAWFITAPINLTNTTGAVLTFQQQIRIYQATTKVQISIDGGITWSDILTNTAFSSPQAEWKTVNISATAVGQSDVRFKFIFTGTYYHWMIDDITVYRPSVNDIMMSSTAYTQYGNPVLDAFEDLEYDQYPSIMIPPFNFSAKATNVGSAAQTGVNLNVKVFNPLNAQIANQTSGTISMNPGQISTLNAGGPYTPPALNGDYNIVYTINQSQTDETPLNNKDTLDFTISPFTYARDEGPMADVFTPAAIYQNQRLEIGNLFQPRSTGLRFPSMSVAVGPGTEPGTVIRGYVYDQNIDTLLAVTAPYTVNLADINQVGEEKLITLYLETPMTLVQDSLLMVMVGNESGDQPLRVCRSGSSPDYTSFVTYPDVNGLFYLLKTPVVRMNIFNVGVIPGCTNSTAMNYNPAATLNDGSCDFPGCTIEGADNYNPNANYDNGTCIYYGCMDPEAFNYFPYATNDDGSCVYAGCTDPNAPNFDPIATVEDGSCIYTGCTNPDAINYDAQANTDDGSCMVPGCMNPEADNYDPDANIDANNCLFYGCTNPLASNYDPQANADNGSCLIFGCTDVLAANYNPNANFSDGSCLYPGCTNPIAINFDPGANTDDGSCIILGCIDTEAVNYNPIATTDDGSCVYEGCTDVNASNFDPMASIDDGSCEYLGCTIPSANNYNPYALVDDGSCLFYGCTDVTASNYSSVANFNDGSCVYAFASLTASNTSGCIPLTVSFHNATDLSLGGYCTFQDDNGYSYTECQTDFDITYEHAGTYTMTYTFLYGGNLTTAEVVVNVYDIPNAASISLDQNLLTCYSCEGNTTEWYYYGNPINPAGGIIYDPYVNNQFQNGWYQIDLTSPEGCFVAGEPTYFLQPQLSVDITESCGETTVNFTNNTQVVEETSCQIDWGDGTSTALTETSFSYTYSEAQTYFPVLSCTNDFAAGTDQETITIHPVPNTVTVILGGQPFEALCVGCEGATAVQWNILDYFGSEVTFDNVNSIISDGNDQGTITLTNEFGCSTTSNFNFIYIGVEEKNGPLIAVQPNPAAEQFTVMLRQGGGKIVVRDINGRLVEELTNVTMQNTLSCDKWPSGIYSVQWIDGENFGTIKVIVQH